MWTANEEILEGRKKKKKPQNGTVALNVMGFSQMCTKQHLEKSDVDAY